MKQLGPRLVDEVLRRDLGAFIHRTMQTVCGGQPYLHNWHIEAIAYQLGQVAVGKVRRLIITLPPRYLKSTCASVGFPAWLLGRDPTAKIVCVSYGEDLTSKLALDCRTVMQSPWYRRAFPAPVISREKNRELDFVTTAGGGRYSTTVGGPLTGRGGDIIIVDDPLKPVDAMSEAKRGAVNEWFDRTLYSRLNDKRSGAIVVVGQRLHVEDLTGHLLAKDQGWKHLSLPAIAEIDEDIPIGPAEFYARRRGEVLHEEREPRPILEELRRSLGSFNFSAQYQQCPVPLEGELIKWAWFQYYQELPARAGGDTVVQSWDTANKATELSDYSVCTTWFSHDGHYYLLDVLRKKLLYPDLRRQVIEHAKTFGAATVLIEDKGSGTSLLQDLSYRSMPQVRGVVGITPVQEKVTRMSAQSVMIEAGRVYLPERAPWLDEFRAELLQFPAGRYDDQVDSLSQFLGWAAHHSFGRRYCAARLGPISIRKRSDDSACSLRSGCC